MKDLTNEIMAVVEAEGFDYMPTRMDLERLGHKTLASRIGRNGGFSYWRDKLKLKQKVKRRLKWTDKDIEDAILDVLLKMKKDLGITGYMPTAKQVQEYSGGSYSLTTAITRSGGFRKWSDKLGLLNQDSTFKMGADFEEKARKTLSDMGYKTEMTELKHPYDILLESCVKINVKSCMPTVVRGSRVHTIGINDKHQNCDLYYVYCLNEDGVTVEKELIIPSHHLSGTNLNMGKKSKYDKYEKKFEYIELYKDFFLSIKSMI